MFGMLISSTVYFVPSLLRIASVLDRVGARSTGWPTAEADRCVPRMIEVVVFVDVDAQHVCKRDSRRRWLALYEARLRCAVRAAGPRQLARPWVRIVITLATTCNVFVTCMIPGLDLTSCAVAKMLVTSGVKLAGIMGGRRVDSEGLLEVDCGEGTPSHRGRGLGRRVWGL